MGLCLTSGLRWNSGYRTIGVIQTVLVLCLLMTLSLWEKSQKDKSRAEQENQALTLKEMLRLPGVKSALVGFFCYCSLEATTGLWASSYMVLQKGIDARTAAKWAAIFYLGITAGRFISGFITGKVGGKNMVRLGQALAGLGTLLIMFSSGNISAFLGLVLIGIGCAPIFPSLLHETPENFGEDKSQAIMGMQMASAYIGTTFMPLLFGFVAEKIGIWSYPLFLMIFVVVMLIMVEKLNRIQTKKGRR
ncbi:MAG TPA: MFS transporter, partial [Bacillota bacterium]